jgi:co-chaperonin GroES (HSP10)
MMSDFRAYGNRILIDVSDYLPGKTKGGLHLPENTRVDPIGTGEVVSVGQGVMTAHGWDSPQVKVGDVVLFERARAQMIDRENYIVAMWAGEILGVKGEGLRRGTITELYASDLARSGPKTFEERAAGSNGKAQS